MSHTDKIKDCDAFFVVDAITRQIINKTPAKIVIMQGDHNSERFTFSLPRYIEGHDMAESAKAKLHYKNAAKPDIEGMYEMKDLQIDPEDSEKVKCSWLISGNATKEAGQLAFLIVFECYDGDVLVYSWHTQTHKGISVGETFDNAEEIAKMYPDIFEQWEREIFGEGCKALSDDSVAMGNNSVAGVKGYYCYKHIPTDAETGNRILIISDKQYTANDDNYQYKDIVDTSKIEVGDKISIGDSRKVYLDCSTVVGVANSYIVVDTVPFEHFGDVVANDIKQTDRFIFIVDKPDVGHSVVGTYAMALGHDNMAIGYGSFSCGAGNISAGSLSYTEGHANCAGFIAHAEGLKTDANSYSHAEGLYTKASGIGSHAEGEFAIASGSYSHAEGQRSESIGNVAHSEGYETKAEGSASHTEGLITHAVGEGSHAEGKATKANAKYSHAEGLSTQANGEQSHAEGSGTIAKGNHSHAEGYQTQANSGDAHAEGAYTKANGGNSHAEGHTTTAKGTNSHAEGSSTVAEGVSSHAEGNNTKALADYSHAEGNGTTASGVHSHAEGVNTVASGRHSHAEGYQTQANSGDAHAEGAYTKAKGENSHAEGYYTIASGKDSHVQGRYNIEDTENKYAHIVGNGTSGSPSNAHTVDWDGNAWFEGYIECKGFIMTSPNGTKFKLTVSDSGELKATAI